MSEDERLTSLLHIHLERLRTHPAAAEDLATWQLALLEGLRRVNRDFREVSRLFDPAQLIVHDDGAGTGPFPDRDLRVKNRTVA